MLKKITQNVPFEIYLFKIILILKQTFFLTQYKHLLVLFNINQ